MKRIFNLLLIVIFLCTFSACSSKTANENNTSSKTPSNEISSESRVENTNSSSKEQSTPKENDNELSKEQSTKKKDNKSLVVYYSSTGNTKNIAKYIADETSADSFELVPKELYTSDDLNWNDKDSRVCVEHDNPDKRNVELTSATVSNWDSYDTVYIGYPIWWGIAAWPVDTFVHANDFTGKTVIPFCTSASSELGESGNLLAEMAGTGDWQEGKRFSSQANKEDVVSWIESLK